MKEAKEVLIGFFGFVGTKHPMAKMFSEPFLGKCADEYLDKLAKEAEESEPPKTPAEPEGSENTPTV